MNKAFISLGGNIGDRLENLKKAASYLSENAGSIIKSSTVYETASWGKTDQPNFLNQVLLLETEYTSADLIKIILDIEEMMGRKRSFKNASRVIDIDILFYNKQIIDQTSLKIPHPEIQNRRFVLIPLNEIAADFVHPVLNEKITALLYSCKDTLAVNLYNQEK